MKALILLNLGTPDAPKTPEVRRYLRQFLMDPYVVDIPWFFRALLVYGVILPTRPAKSAEAYRKVWTQNGSPLLHYLLALTEKVSKLLGSSWITLPAMRYGNPSVESAFRKLAQSPEPLEEIVVLPLYPQYSLAATESSIAEARQFAKKHTPSVPLKVIGAFYDRPEFLDAFKAEIESTLKNFEYDHLLFSFHGLPERQIKRVDATGSYCLAAETCCDKVGDANRHCYRAQCFATAHALAKRLGISPERYTVSFQSRLGRTPWIKPYTDILYREFPKRGIKRLAVACPAFVSDCLETLEEIKMRGLEDFRKEGGEDLQLIPSLNASDPWAKGVVAIATGKGASP
jgi:ferrochelatase